MGTPPLTPRVDVDVERGHPWPTGPAWARARRTAAPLTADLVEAARQAVTQAHYAEPTRVAILIAATHADVDVATAPLRESVATWDRQTSLTAHLYDELPMFTYLRGLVSVQGQHVAAMVNSVDGLQASSTLAVTAGDAAALAARTAATALEVNGPQAVLLLEVRSEAVRTRLWDCTPSPSAPVFAHASAMRSGLGNTEQTWAGVRAGRSGISPARDGLLDGVPCAAAEARTGDVDAPRTESLALAVAREVMPPVRRRLGVVYAPMWPGHQGSEADDWTSDIAQPTDTDTLADALSPEAYCRVEATCAGGLRALIEAARMVASGDVDDAIAVAAVARNNPYHLSQFAQLTALSTWPGDPREASRPFAPDRAGMVMAEGAAAVLLSRTPGGVELTSAATSVDPAQPTAPSSDFIDEVFAATWAPQSLISAHGTGTAANDDAEADVISRRAPGDAVFAAKALTGHASSASGLLEVAVGLRALAEQVCPPTPRAATPGVHTVDELTPSRALHLVKNSFGFGGQYASVRLTMCSGSA